MTENVFIIPQLTLHKGKNVPTVSNFPLQKRNLRENIMPTYPRVRGILRDGESTGLTMDRSEQLKENPEGTIEPESTFSPESA